MKKLKENIFSALKKFKMFIKSEYITSKCDRQWTWVRKLSIKNKKENSEYIILYLFPITCEYLNFEILNLFSKLKLNIV